MILIIGSLAYISSCRLITFQWLEEQLSQKRFKVNVKEGDIVAFRIAYGEYGFARRLLDIFF